VTPEERALTNARLRERYANDPEYRARLQARNREGARKRLASSPEYRERKNKRNLENEKARYANDPEYRERRKRNNRENARKPEYRERTNARNRQRRATDPEYRERQRETQQVRARKRIYGLTHEQYLAMVESQGGVCALCRQHKYLTVDHCHETGVVRGLLCQDCNTSLGKLGDTPASLQRVLRYLLGEEL
jgi:hypothetical protein